jgi:predicted nucleotide-binding protein
LRSRLQQKTALLPVVLDMQAVLPHSASEFFNAIYSAVTEDTALPPWPLDATDQPYRRFLSLLDGASATIEANQGPDWTIVLLIDEFDLAALTLPDSGPFQQLRSLLMFSKFSRRIRVVASGISIMSDLIKGEGSPLNNLDPEFLRILSIEEGQELISRGFGSELPSEMQDLVFKLTGLHPYLLQGLLSYLWEYEPVDEQAVRLAARRLVRDRMDNFRRWVTDFGPHGRAVYETLAKSHRGALSQREIRCAVRSEIDVDAGLRALAYHGAIDESDPDRLGVAGTIFRDWFVNNFALEGSQYGSSSASLAPPVPSQVAVPPIRSGRSVFVVHGRNENVRVAMFTFLRSIGLEPLEWTEIVEATKDAAPFVGEVLEKGFSMATAAVVLLTPDDEARLRPEYHTPNDPEYETKLSSQPRPNVLFEAGMAMALFPKKTVLVQVGPIRPFSDISGIHLLQLDDSIAKRKALAKRLEVAGCNVDLNNTEWHTAGKFSA